MQNVKYSKDKRSYLLIANIGGKKPIQMNREANILILVKTCLFMYKPNELKDLSDHFYHWGKRLSQIQDRKNSHVYKHTDKRAPQILN